MITCDILGHSSYADNDLTNNGIGNQLFCVATTLALANDNNTIAVFPDLNFYPYELYGRSIFHKLNKGVFDKSFVQHTYTEKPYSSTIYNKIEYKKNMCIHGHFQSYKYFHNYEKQLQEAITLPDFYTKTLDEKYGHLYNKKTVSLHYRRKDYLKFKQIYPPLGEDYYLNALSKVGEYDTIVLFSDDMKWVENNTDYLPGKKVYVEGEMDFVDLYLMSKMKNNIIANSTFSWWGAYLNKNENKKVVAPWNWFGPGRVSDNHKETIDLIPESWTRI